MKNWLGSLQVSLRRTSRESLLGALISLKFQSTRSSLLQSTTNSPLVMFLGIITINNIQTRIQKLISFSNQGYHQAAVSRPNVIFTALQNMLQNCINVMFEPLFPRVASEFGPNLSLFQFEVLGKLGKGTFGQVNLYRHIATGKEYAIKRIQLAKEGKKTVSKDEIEMLTRKELQILYKIDNEHIIRLIDHFEDKDAVYLITEFIQGANLYDQTLKISRHLPNEIIADIIYQICQGLEELHNNHVIHRDIKLQNLMYNHDNVKIVDLGCSNFYGQNISRQTTIGTRLYWSPEIIGQEEQNDRLDVWCTGVVLYELLYLQQPFSGNDFERKIRKCEYGFPGEMPPEPELEDLFRRVFTHKNLRLTAAQLKNHNWIKKYRLKEDEINHYFQKYFTQDETDSYREFLQNSTADNIAYLDQIKSRTQMLENLLKQAKRQLKKK